MAGPLDAVSGNLSTNSKTAELLITALDAEGQVDRDLGPKIVQYFPENISQSDSANWQSRPLPGSNRPLQQWISGGENSFTMTLQFTRDMSGKIGEDVEEDKYNVDIDAALAWLHLLKSNDYTEIGDNSKTATPPPTLWLYVKGTKSGAGTILGYNTRAEGALGESRSGGLYCHLTEVGTERENWFQEGTTRKAVVSVTFEETIQIGQGIYPYGRSDFINLASRYTRSPS